MNAGEPTETRKESPLESAILRQGAANERLGFVISELEKSLSPVTRQEPEQTGKELEEKKPEGPQSPYVGAVNYNCDTIERLITRLNSLHSRLEV